MLKVVLKCHGSSDGRITNLVLAKHGIPILKTKERLCGTDRLITIVVCDYEVLNDILFEMNKDVYWDVQVVKVKQLKEKRRDKKE